MNNLNSNKIKNGLINKLKQGISILLAIVMVLSLLQIGSYINFGETQIIDWRKNDTMDINLNIVRNKAGVDDLFFEMDLQDSGTYVLEYYLEENRKTTVTFNNSYDQLDIKFKVQEYNTVTPSTPLEITQSLIDLSYLEIDYAQQAPAWKSVSKTVDPITETLDFVIERSASARYPGIAFQMDNKKFIMKWDFQNDMLYVLFDKYENGHIMPVKFTNPDIESQTIKALKGLEDFNVTPTYLTEDPDNPGTNIEIAPVTHPNGNNDKPGNRPGLRYNFYQPKELNDTTWAYEYNTTDLSSIRAIFEVEDIGSNDYLDFNMLLHDGGDTRIYEIPSENGDQTNPANYVDYVYDNITHKYEVLIVQDKSDLAHQDEIIEWEDLSSSRIYNTSIGFQFENPMPNYEFANFVPEGNFAYTYLEYQLKRSDQQEAFLELVPYQLGTQDEIEYVVLYSKIIAAELDPINDLWLKHYQSDGGLGNINIPVPFRANSYQDAYQIIVNFSGNELKSQVLNYRAIDDLNVPPTTPSIIGIENLYVVPPEDEINDNPTKIQFDFVWEAITNRASSELDDIFEDLDPAEIDAVYYEVLVNDIPDINDDNPFQVFRVYEVYQEGGLYKVRVHANTSASDIPSNTTNYVQGYNSIDELFRMEKIVAYENDLWTNRIDTVYDEDADTYSITERTDISHPTSHQTDFEFPGVNYIRIRAITEKDGVLGVSNYSVPISLSLSMLKYDIPIVEGITYEPFFSLIDTDPMGIDLKWPSINISTYENNMLYPVDKNATGITYSVYISEDKVPILDLNDNNDDYTLVLLDGAGDVVIGAGELALLRGEDDDGNGNVLFFEIDKAPEITADISTRIEGLDLNNNYYARIVVNVDVHNNNDGTDTVRRGEPSSLISITTPIVPPEPGEDDIIPLAPENLIIEFLDDSQLSASLEWIIPNEVTIEEDKFGFEILAIEDLRLPDSLSTKGTNILDIINDEALEETGTEAWRIYYEGADIVLKKYNEETSTWDIQDFSLLTTSDAAVRMIDDSNSPNRVNYYYVRTINVNGGAAVKASSWQQGSLTTSPVKGPINLRIDYDSEFTVNEKYETIVRFDAPVPDTAIVDSDFVMEIFIKGDKDLDYVEATKVLVDQDDDDTYYSRLMGQEDGSVGYKRFYYKISGLEAGKQYIIKVRVEDRTKNEEILPDGSTTYPKSPFSKKVTTRTEFDQNDYDKEQKYKQYIDYYLKKAEELKQKPYFILGETEEEISVKYRLSYVDGLLQLSKNNDYELVGFSQGTSTYYLPSEMIESGNDLNITYTVQPNNQHIALKPYSIGAVITDEINTVVDAINDYDATLEDYYIQIRLMTGDYSGTIYGQQANSQLVNIEMNVIGSKNTEENIDLFMENEMNQAINGGKNELLLLLEEELDRGINDVILAGIVQKVIKDVEQNFSIFGDLKFKSYLDNTTYPIVELSNEITIGLIPDNINASNTIYSRTTGDWKVESAVYYDNRYHVYTKELGSFVSVDLLAGTELGNLYNQEQIKVINKYGLTDIFTSYELKNPDDLVNNMQMVQTYARLIGANADNDEDSYLKSHNINVPYLNDFNMSNREVANYLYVQVYTNKHQINLNAVVIRDYNAIEDIIEVNAAYQGTLLKGVGLGIIELNNGQLLPSKQITVGEILEIIENIE